MSIATTPPGAIADNPVVSPVVSPVANPLDLSARQGNPATLALALAHSRACTLALVDTVQAALPTLQVPQRSELNPPLWELGHIGWFQDFWLGRNPQRGHGAAADPDAPRHPAARPDADALYDSSRVPQASRWALALPSAEATRADLAAQLANTQALLQQADHSDAALYFFRLALVHEDMHHEAGLYMAQALGIAIDDASWQPPQLPAPPPALAFGERTWCLGSPLGSAAAPGFAFDNELGAHPVVLGATEIDAQVLRWAEFLPFITAGGHADPRCWSAPGNAWRLATCATTARYLRQQDGQWQQCRHGRWQPLDLQQPACHLSFFEAEAWCHWAGRRLPTEAEWEHAAITGSAPRPDRFRWGDVWEWTASSFAPYPGFVAHPYRDYSAPWFDGRPVLRGGSFMTHARMKHPRYRNYFAPARNDVPAGFRSCAR